MNTEKINPEGHGSGADMPTGEEQAVPVKSPEQDAVNVGPEIVRDVVFGERSPEVVAEQAQLQEPEPTFGSQDIANAKAREKEEIEFAKTALGLPAMQSQMDEQGVRLQKLIDALKAQGGVLHEEI